VSATLEGVFSNPRKEKGPDVTNLVDSSQPHKSPRNGGETPQIPRDAKLRQLIDEMLWGIGVYANTARDFAEMGDDAGLEYSYRQLSSRVAMVRDLLLRLREARP
jgi:hypothetical protein